MNRSKPSPPPQAQEKPTMNNQNQSQKHPPHSPPPAENQPGDSSGAAPALDAIGSDFDDLTKGSHVTGEGASETGAHVTGNEPPASLLTIRDVMPWAVVITREGGKFVTKQTGIEYTPETVNEVAEALAPVIVKYQTIPPWLLPYMDEFKLGMVLAGVAFKTWSMMNAAATKGDTGKPAAEAAQAA